jgi:hypothetical protein
MKGAEPSKPVVLAARLRSSARPRLEIAPDVRQYERLCDDLKLLRRLGAISNTDAIIDAVHERAERMDKVSRRSGKPTGRRATATRSRDTR